MLARRAGVVAGGAWGLMAFAIVIEQGDRQCLHLLPVLTPSRLRRSAAPDRADPGVRSRAERPICDRGIAVAAHVALLAAWEWQMRALQLIAGDLTDSASAWAEQRRLDADDPARSSSSAIRASCSTPTSIASQS